jgi:hypothetical protein
VVEKRFRQRRMEESPDGSQDFAGVVELRMMIPRNELSSFGIIKILATDVKLEHQLFCVYVTVNINNPLNVRHLDLAVNTNLK